MRKLLFIFCFIAILVVAATAAQASNGDEVSRTRLPSPAVYTELQESADGTAYVIVMLEPVAGVDAMSKKQRQKAVKEVQQRVLNRLAPGEFTVAHKYENLAAITGRVNAAGLDKLAAYPEVIEIGPDAPGHGALDDSVPFINADNVHSLGYTGQGITVAVLDTGIDSDHPDLSDDIAPGWYHFLNQATNVGPGAEDDHGHGTNVSGIITSKGVVAPVGVAPDADILAIKVLDSGSSGWASDWAAGVDYVVSHKDDYDHLCIINMSLSTFELFSQCPCDNVGQGNPDYAWLRLLRDALNAAKNVGIVTFAATGNNGKLQMSAPACLSAATAVAAVYDQDLGREPDATSYNGLYGGIWPHCFDATTYGDLLTCFSNRNSCNELAAPGRHITAPGMGGGTSTMTGTSQATPHCSGVAALMYEKAVSLGISIPPDQTVQIMKDTGASTTDPAGTSPNPKRVNALAAVNAIPTVADTVVCEPQGGVNPMHPPTYWYDVTPGDSGRCDFHVRVFDPNSSNYTNPSLPAPTWQFAVHQVSNEWWASWWDPNCTNSIFDTFRFQFDNINPSTWGDWTTTIGTTWNPYDRCACDGNVVDTSAVHATEPYGYGYRVHVPRISHGYIISWSTIDGGGGQSSGGQYVLTGTIGQPDTGYSAGGQYELLGGFWSGGPLCVVNFEHFARFADHWLETGCDAGDDWCGGADLDYLGDVNSVDLGLFVDEWLDYCPYDWPLR